VGDRRDVAARVSAARRHGAEHRASPRPVAAANDTADEPTARRPRADPGGPTAAAGADVAGAGAEAAAHEGGRRHTLRYRVLPRSLLGMAALILSFALGAGFSGVVLYSYFQFHLDQTNSRVNNLINGYSKQFKNAEGDLQAQTNAAQKQIANSLAPLAQLQADPKVLQSLIKSLAPSVYFVHTEDASGQPSVGTAFVISSNSSQSLLITSATTVAASQASPGPTVYVSKNNQDTAVQVRSVDTQNDLALIVLSQGNLPIVKVAPSSPPPVVGDKVYAVSGLGSAGASVSSGTITDVSAGGVATNTPIGTAFQGGPLVNAQGQLVAVASRTYSPNGFATSGVWYAPYPQAACSKVLSCPGGSIGASQQQ
jgi:hypothetical protein